MATLHSALGGRSARSVLWMLHGMQAFCPNDDRSCGTGGWLSLTGVTLSNSRARVQAFHLTLYVPDLDARRHFYTTHVRCPIVGAWDGSVGDRGVMFDTGAGRLEFLEHLQGVCPVERCAVSLRVPNGWALWEEWKEQPNVVVR